MPRWTGVNITRCLLCRAGRLRLVARLPPVEKVPDTILPVVQSALEPNLHQESGKVKRLQWLDRYLALF